MRILVVAERGLADVVRQALEREGHSAALAHSENRAVEMAKALPFDAIALEYAPPTLDGFKIARSLSQAGVRAQILMLISKDAVRDAGRRVTEAGADDFLVKPFSLAELTARLRTMVGRGQPRQSSRLQVADLTLDPRTHEVFRSGTQVTLTRKEFQLLEILLREAGRVVHREDLMEELWPAREQVENNMLDAFIRLLRRKIDRGHEPKLIHTVRGFGYRLSDESK